jgi:predicted hotdog family 3-hydroxylacyl-ACP dehydratase
MHAGLELRLQQHAVFGQGWHRHNGAQLAIEVGFLSIVSYR